MGDERKLADVVMGQQLWAEAATELFRDGWEVQEQAEYYGAAFVQVYREGDLSRNQFKKMVKAANLLECEAIRQAGGAIENLKDDADYIEAVGRRVAHHALKFAFETTAYGTLYYYRGRTE